MTSKTIDYRDQFQKVVSDSTIKTYVVYASSFKSWVEEQETLTDNQNESLADWEVSKKHYFVPLSLCTDDFFSKYLSWCWADAQNRKIEIYPHVRKVHGFLAHSLSRNNLVPFVGRKDASVSSYPLTETVWSSMQKKDAYTHYDPIRENNFLSLAETNLIRKRDYDFNNIDETQLQLIFMLNIFSSCRPETMKRLNSNYCTTWEIQQDQYVRKRGEMKCVIIKTNQHGLSAISSDKDQAFRFSCCCPIGHHDATNKQCPVAVLDKHLKNIKTSDETLKKDLEVLNKKLKWQQERPKPSPNAIRKTKTSIEKIQNLFDPLTHTPLIRTVKFGNRSNGSSKENYGKVIGFKPSAAHSAFKHTRNMISKCLKRTFVFYDGRKTAPNAIKNQAPKLGIKISDDHIAKYCTHNSVTTLNKHYISHKNEDEKFAPTEAFSFLQTAQEHGFDERQSNSVFIQRKRQLELQNAPRKKICLPKANPLQLQNGKLELQNAPRKKFCLPKANPLQLQNGKKSTKESPVLEKLAYSSDKEITNEFKENDLLTQIPNIESTNEIPLTEEVNEIEENNTSTQICTIPHRNMHLMNENPTVLTQNTQNLTQITINSPATKFNPLSMLIKQNFLMQQQYYKQQENNQKMNERFLKQQFDFQNNMMKLMRSQFQLKRQ